jgi:hypothetical protein
LFYCFHSSTPPLLLREREIICLTMAVLRVETDKTQHLLRSVSGPRGFTRRNVRLTLSYQSFCHTSAAVCSCKPWFLYITGTAEVI